MLDQRLVEVEAAQVGQARLGQHLEAGRRAAHHRRVEGAAAQVVDGQRAPHRHGAAEHRRVVGGGRDRLHDEAGGGQAGGADRLDQHGAAPFTPAGRMGDPDLLDRAAQVAGGLGGEAAEHGGDHAGYRQLLLAQQHHTVVDAALRVGFEPGRVEPCGPLGVPPHQQPAVRVEVHGRRQQRRAVEQQGPRATVRAPDHRHRVRRAKVDAQHPHGRHPTVAGDMHTARREREE
jgi:hypothetical protein